MDEARARARAKGERELANMQIEVDRQTGLLARDSGDNPKRRRRLLKALGKAEEDLARAKRWLAELDRLEKESNGR